MNSLLIIAHGSRRQASNDEIRELTKKVSALSSDNFDLIECAFLELAEPSIPAGFEKLINSGAKKVQVLPYFLAAGLHVTSDIPKAVKAARAAHPTIDITTSQYLGEADILPTLLMQIAVNSQSVT